MTVRFRIESMRLDTTNGAVTHSFPRDLTVLVGQTGVGKTTLLELIKYGLGGDGHLLPVARQNVTDVHVSIRVGDERLQLSRGLDPDRQKSVRVLDLVTGDRMRDHSVGGDEPTISDLLLSAIGLEPGLRAAARGGRSISAGAEITFNDVFRFMYVPQSEMNHDIAWSQQGYYSPKRKAVFELLFGLTSASLLQMRSEINTLRSEIDDATHDAEVVGRFLHDTGLESRVEAEVRRADAQRDEGAAEAVLASLRGDLSAVVDQESQVFRDLLTNAERALAEATSLATELDRQHSDYATERRRVQLDIDRLARMASAGQHLASIEFAICPRCTQRVDQRDVPAGACRVCLQPDIVAGLPAHEQYETGQLQVQLQEIDAQLGLLADQAAQTKVVRAERERLVRSLSAEIDARTASRVTPRLQAYADTATRLERARAAQRSLEQVLRQWDRADDLKEAAEALAERRAVLHSSVQQLERDLAQRKSELIGQLDVEFQATVTAFGIPSIETAAISPDSYLPIMNGQPFDQVSSGGGIITATQVAYWISLLTVAARRHDTFVPAFLLLDSPRLALNAEHDIAGQMYRRFTTQVGVTEGRFQFIVVDNELPEGITTGVDVRAFSYESPTVDTVKHPGPAHVQPLGAAEPSDAIDT